MGVWDNMTAWFPVLLEAFRTILVMFMEPPLVIIPGTAIILTIVGVVGSMFRRL